MENIILIIYAHMQFHMYKISTQAFDPSAIFLLILVSHRVIQNRMTTGLDAENYFLK